MGIAVGIVNRLLMLMYKKCAESFELNIHNLEEEQEKLLLNIISNNKDTEYGKRYDFAGIKNIADFKAKVPITEYPDYEDYISRIAEGGENLLTKDRVNMFEVTGGSGGHVKLIPYTNGLKEEFLQGIKPWIYSLYRDFPTLRDGKSYWSITPPTFEKRYTDGGVPIGFEDDTAYFGRVEQFLTDIIFVRDKGIRQESDIDSFYFNTCLCLLKERALTLISVWNPSYLLILLGYIKENQKRLISALPKKRKTEIERFIEAENYEKIWPKLTLISCWCDAHAKQGGREIANLFPNVHIQPKGILATEAFMTLPYRDTKASLLSYRSHYFEFSDMESGEIVPYSRLIKGRRYEIIFTTSGGLYRYKINDSVVVSDFTRHSVPLLNFVGKTDKTSDYHGEKLNELFLKEILEKLEQTYDISNSFKLFAYEKSGYMLFIEDYFDEEFAVELENMLCESYHYKLCRELGQLAPVKIESVRGDLKQVYLNFYLNKGKKLGDIKPEVLSLHTGWLDAFTEGNI